MSGSEDGEIVPEAEETPAATVDDDDAPKETLADEPKMTTDEKENTSEDGEIKSDEPKEEGGGEEEEDGEVVSEKPNDEPTEELGSGEAKDEPMKEEEPSSPPEKSDEKPSEEEEKETEDKEENDEEEKEEGEEKTEEKKGEEKTESVEGPEEGEQDDASKADEDQSVGEDPMDTTEEQSASQNEPTEEAAASKELPYSTRGRSTGTATSDTGGSGAEKGAEELLLEIGRSKDPTDALGASFLESLTEEERRMRTRFLPEVEGMHLLRKHEVKDDMTLARSLVSAAGVTSIKKSKGKRSRSDEDGMDVDEEGGASPSEDDRMSDVPRLGTSTIELATRDLVVPSNAFVAPPGTSMTSSNEDGSEGREHPSASSSRGKNGVQSPLVVNSVTAFNPPRPPESIGAKKKHRMLRWERRPEDVEVDLNNYRKTVQRTRQELHNAEAEYERLETIDAHLRWHFMGHLNLLNEEYTRLNDELGSIQQECVKASDLLTSRTRSRGAGKGSQVMKDVLSVLKVRGEGSGENDSSVPTPPPAVWKPLNPGVGGLSSIAFSDWVEATNLTRRQLASSWLVPGEKVKTPYGEGTVVELQPFVTSSDKDLSSDPKDGDSSKGNTDKTSVSSPEKNQKSSKQKKAEQKKEEEKASEKKEPSPPASTAPPRVTVKLPFGVGHFIITAVSPIENPALLSDAKLVKRWKGIVETSLQVAGCLDLEGMASEPTEEKDTVDDAGNEDNAQMDVDKTPGDPEQPSAGEDSKGLKAADGKFLPFGSGMLPTSMGRGSLLQKMSITDIEEAIDDALFDGHGVLGTVCRNSICINNGNPY